MKTSRLVIGIISIVLFVLVTLQSCAAGLSNSLAGTGETSGTSGLLLAICLLVSGVVGIATRNASNKVGAIVSAVFCIVGALIGFSGSGSYSDLVIWSVVCLIFAVIYIIAAVKTKSEAKKDKE